MSRPPESAGSVMVCESPRRSWGSLLPAMGWARCYRCRRPSWSITPRRVMHSQNEGQWAVCTHCWPRMAAEERLEAHRWVTWVVQGGAHTDRWLAIVEAVWES